MKKFIEKYQCVGCMNGHNTSCFEKDSYGIGCGKHTTGTFVSGIGGIFLGMPKGFNRKGFQDSLKIIITGKVPPFKYDKFNVPVWKYQDKNCILVRGLHPRLNQGFLHVIINGDIKSIKCLEITLKDMNEMD